MLKTLARTALFSGAICALLLTLLQALWVSPLILEAETYEQAGATSAVEAHAHEHAAGHDHAHDEEGWSPADGWPRLLFTALSNLVVAVGFSLVLSALYLLREPGRLWQGLLWGAAGFATFCLAPATGLPPELPGTAAADLLARQYWWIAAAGATAGGLALIAFGRPLLAKVAGLCLLAVPHLFGAPQPEVHQALAPEDLQSRFIHASLVTNALFWLALGLVSTWIWRHGADHAL